MVIDHVIGTHFFDPGNTLRSRRGGDHLQMRELFGQLNQNRTDAASRADDEQGLIATAAFTQAKRIEEQLPGGDGRQGHARRLCEAERTRLFPDDTFVDGVKGRIRARAGDVAGVEDLVANLEQMYLAADLAHDACGVIANHLALARGRPHLRPGADLDIHRIYGNPSDFHK